MLRYLPTCYHVIQCEDTHLLNGAPDPLLITHSSRPNRHSFVCCNLTVWHIDEIFQWTDCTVN